MVQGLEVESILLPSESGLEWISDFEDHWDGGMYIESDGDVYDVVINFDGTTYSYEIEWDDGVIMKFSQLSNGLWSGYNYEYEADMSGTYTLGSSGGLTTLTVVIESPPYYSGTEYYIKVD